MSKIPSAFVPHGGGPLPLLNDAGHKSLIDWLKSFVSKYVTPFKPTSILVISAHWEAPVATVQTGETTSLYYDYYGFPAETYNLDYNLKPATALSKRVLQLLRGANIPCDSDSTRGYDHGVFVPLKLMYPAAELPTIQLSLVANLDPSLHIRIGEALAPLKEEGILIIGSGMSYHNMRGYRNPESNSASEKFHEYLRKALTGETSYEKKKKLLENWAKAPHARDNHPREEHLIPLLVLFGTSIKNSGKSEEIYFDNVIGVKCSGYLFP